MLNAYLNKFLIVSASAVSAFGLLLAVPQTATAQEMSEDAMPEATESVELEADESMEMGTDIESDAAAMDSDDIDTDSDFDGDDSDVDGTTYSAPTYSNSPRALW